ncbi:MAG: lytic transglycosylase domain-containing protein [Bacteroidales bacterium]|nr:lytic transglycosylase domain-containing protein [Bacteroidales bacterium]
MNFKNPKLERALLILVYILTLLVVAYVSVSLFVQAACNGAESVDSSYSAKMRENYGNYLPPLPDTLSFCGEQVPLENFDVREALDAEVVKVMYWHSQMFLLLKRANRYFPTLRRILAENNMHEDFIYLCVAESGMDHVVSPAKAVGFWQLLEATGKECGLEINSEVDERYNIEKSTKVACKYLRQGYDKFGSWTLSAAAYNCGQSGLQKLIDRQGVTSYYDLRNYTETGRYVFRILALKLVMQNPEKYGFVYKEKDLYPEIKTRTIEVDSSISNLYEFGKQVTVNYKMLKILNPWLRDNKLTNKDGKTYQIKVLDQTIRENTYKK